MQGWVEHWAYPLLLTSIAILSTLMSNRSQSLILLQTYSYSFQVFFPGFSGSYASSPAYYQIMQGWVEHWAHPPQLTSIAILSTLMSNNSQSLPKLIYHRLAQDLHKCLQDIADEVKATLSSQLGKFSIRPNLFWPLIEDHMHGRTITPWLFGSTLRAVLCVNFCWQYRCLWAKLIS